MTMESYRGEMVEEYEKLGPVVLGPWSSWCYRHNPRYLLFAMSRYKFVGKMMKGMERVLEVGCGDGWGIPLILGEGVGSVEGIDYEEYVVKHKMDGVEIYGHDMRDFPYSPLGKLWDGAYLLDVIEHVPPEDETRFMGNVRASVKDGGLIIVGTPNKAASAYASPQAQSGHVNLKDEGELRELMGRCCKTVLMFGMNDEVVHTGFFPMAHYLLAVGVVGWSMI